MFELAFDRLVLILLDALHPSHAVHGSWQYGNWVWVTPASSLEVGTPPPPRPSSAA
jgi:hypothetical protein